MYLKPFKILTLISKLILLIVGCLNCIYRAFRTFDFSMLLSGEQFIFQNAFIYYIYLYPYKSP